MLRTALIFAMCMAMPAPGQPPEKFEVASVKPVPASRGGCDVSPAGCYSMTPWGGAGMTASNISLPVMIEMAFGVTDNQISGIDRLGNGLYDLSAKPANGSLTFPRAQPMLRAFLEERFKLATHRETKDIAAYALVVAKGGSKLKPSDPAKPGSGVILSGRLINPQATLEVIAYLLTRPLGRPVVNRTNLQGTFDLDLKFAPDGANDTSRPSLVTAVQEQLGLSLESIKAPLEMLVIDHCERVPTEN